MANLTEKSEFTAGVYQFEVTDPVQGGPNGIDNQPTKALANRTRWLKDALDSLGLTVADKADKASPALSGNPTAPTQANGNDSTRLANTAFATAITHGFYSRDVTADGATINLTADQATCGVLLFTGTNATGKTVVVPAFTTPTKSRVLVVENRTGGGGALTVIPAGGTGVTIGNGRSAVVWLDPGTKTIRRALTDYTDAYLVNCLGVTPAANAAGEEMVNARWTLQAIQNASGFKTGDMKPSLNGAEAGWVHLSGDGTIGNAVSGATARGSADCEALFKLIWASIDYGAGMVSGGKGASANADWLAGKTIQLPRMAGRAVGVAGFGAGLTGRPLGGFFGAETHTLVPNEMPSHNHGGSTGGDGLHGHVAWTSNSGNHTHVTKVGLDYGQLTPNNAVYGDQNPYGDGYLESAPAGDHNHTVGVEVNGFHAHSIPGAGGNGAHNNMQPTVFVNWMIKL